LTQYPWINQVEVVEGDAHDELSLQKALAGIDVAYYLLHSLLVKDDFEASELNMAKLFADAASEAKVSRIIYLGGIINGTEELSDHMSARMNTGAILAKSGVPTIEFRAGVVIGSGSASFEMLRYLTERLPIMTTPKWVNNRIQPIAVRDVLRYLIGAAGLPPTVSGVFDIAGPDIFTYADMMQHYAAAAGLKRRIIIPIPVLTPRLSSGWVGLVTPVPYRLARRLVESLKHEVVAASQTWKPVGLMHPFLEHLASRCQQIQTGQEVRYTRMFASLEAQTLLKRFGRGSNPLAATTVTLRRAGPGNLED
jgi:uncharacterized protein YbjT (DUF2867 family)